MKQYLSNYLAGALLKRALIILQFFLGSAAFVHGQSFITTWKTDNPGPSNDNQITIPTTGGGYNYDVDWGDGTSDAGVTGNITHTYTTPGTYTVSISGTFPRIYFNAGGFFGDNTDHDKILTVEQWGSISWTSMAGAFSGCVNLRIIALDAPDLSGVTDMSEMFLEAESLNDNINNWDVITITTMRSLFEDAVSFNQPLNSWNVSNVTNMNEMFRDATSFNQSLDSWDVSSVTDMGEMFSFANAFNGAIGSWNVSNVTNMESIFASTLFNQDIGGWNVGSVTNMDGMFFGTPFNQDISGWNVSSATNIRNMFRGATDFNQDISGWVISSATNMSSMFSGATSFNQDISGWDISNVTNMSFLFNGATAFNADLTGWIVSGVTNMSGMFGNLPSFNQDISGWDVSAVSNMEDMFNNAILFNQDISGWVVSGVSDMSSMFEGASAFNQDVTGWDVSNVDDMRFMFSGATSFDQNLGGWNITDVRFMVGMFDNSGLSVENYDNTLIGWNGQAVRSNVSLGAANVFYCSGDVARAELIANNSWFISDGGQGCISVFDGVDNTTPQIANGQVASVDFGSIDILPSTKSRSITIQNELATDLTNVVISISGATFDVVPAAPSVITGGSSETITVVFSGGVPGTYTETLSITSDDFSGSFDFTLTGEITAIPEPEIAVYEGNTITGVEIVDGQAGTYNFDEELRGTDLTREITITNKGSAPLTIADISFTGSAFSLASTAPASVAVDATEVIPIVLSGTVAGVFIETLTITSNDSDEASFNFDLEGEIIGPDIAVFDGANIFSDPEILDGQMASIDFGSGPQGTDIIRQVTVANLNRLDLIVSDISVSGTAFSIVAVTPFTVAAELDGVISDISFDIVLSGSAPGTFNETVTITSDDEDEPTFTFPISGQIDNVLPEIVVFDDSGTEVLDSQASPIDFGSEVQGTGINKTFSIENQGGGTLSISNISISGTEFIINSALSFPLTINSGGSQLLDILLTGGTVGNFTETVTIESNDADEAQFDFTVTGEITASASPEITVFEGPTSLGTEIFDGQATSYNFGSDILANSITQSVTIENQGTDVLTISNISISGTAFTVNTTIPISILVGNSETVDITLDGSSAGTFSEMVSITSNDPDEAVFNFPIIGEITTPEIEVYIGSSSSGVEIVNGQVAAVTLGTSEQGTDVSQTFTVLNSGSSGLTLSSISLSGSVFSSATSTPIEIANGAENNFIITLSGANTGLFSETVTIANNDDDENPFVFTVEGSIVSPNSVPTISTIADISVDEDVSTGEIPFTIDDVETSANDLVVTAISDNQALINSGGITLGGTDTNRTINISPVPDASGVATITIQVDDLQDVAIESFTVTVVAVNDIPVVTGQQDISTPQNTAVTLGLDDFTVSDVDNNFPTGFSLTVNTGSNYTVNENSITPDVDFVGILTVPIVVNDGQDDSPVFNTIVTVIPGELEVLSGGEPLANGEVINFDDVPVGAQDLQELVITNTGTIPLVITEIIIEGDDFGLESSIPGPIPPDGNATLLISFQPSSVGPKSALLTIRSTSAEDFITTLTASGLSEIPPLEIFNVVTVQQNDKHDFLEIRNIEFYDANRIFIYSRWGNEVFRTADYNNTTNRFVGNSDDGGELPDGTYYYVIELNGGEIVENGFFLLRR